MHFTLCFKDRSLLDLDLMTATSKPLNTQIKQGLQGNQRSRALSLQAPIATESEAESDNPVQIILPSPLSLPSEDWVKAVLGIIRGTADDGRPLGGRLGALKAYRIFFREANQDALFVDRANPNAPAQKIRFEVPPVVHTMREDSLEGEVVKFITRVGTGIRDSSGKLRMPGRIPEKLNQRWLAESAENTSPTLDANLQLVQTTQTGTTEVPLEIESVLIPMVGSSGQTTYTLCVSSQVGCAMGCTFCETAQMGLIRSLTAAEIASQWWNATHVIGIRPKNIVFMGMGEPMDNLDAVLAAIAVMKDNNGGNIAVSQVTISTVGRVDGIRKLREHVMKDGWHRLGLALSLNAPNDADRSAIMPVNRTWNLSMVRDALLDWPRYSANKVCVEYVLIPGVNDTERHAQEIADFMKPFGLCEPLVTLGRDGVTMVSRINGTQIMAILNLIPYNPRRNSPWPAPEEAHVEQFLGWLIARGVFAKRRRTKGRQMMGACGQLGAAHIRGRKVVPMASEHAVSVPIQMTVGGQNV